MICCEWRPFPCSIGELSLKVLIVGQSFRWKRIEIDDVECFEGVAHHRVWHLKQDRSRIFYKCLAHFSRSQTTFKTDEEALVDYFQLKLLNLEKLNGQWLLEDGHFAEVLSNARGLRILRQDPTECLFSFICSSNNNIKRISSMVESLCELYGEKLNVNLGLEQQYSETCSQKTFYDFPSISSIYKNCGHDDVVSDLRRRNFGYRAPYVAQTVKHLIGKFGSDRDNIEMELLKMRDRTYEECAEFLTSLPGVGPKVADCVSLMSLDKHYVVPVDRHVLRLTVRHYMPQLKNYKSLTKVARKSISNFYLKKFGQYAGWAQAVLFASEI